MARNYSYDSLMVLDDGGAAHAASGVGQVGGVNKFIDLGGSPTNTEFAAQGLVGALTRLDAMCVLEVSALTNAATDLATVSLMGSNNSGGSNPVVLASLPLGYGGLIPNGTHSTGGAPAGTGSDSYAGKYEMPFTNEQNGVIYEFVYLYITIAGGGSITLIAFIAPQAIE